MQGFQLDFHGRIDLWCKFDTKAFGIRPKPNQENNGQNQNGKCQASYSEDTNEYLTGNRTFRHCSTF
ncbi:hypothetical protein [Tropicibacter alexandrii]|uniref:hypothetical protein n=1 Tax=Tropicibacter alexandrii TaxID=2267683 RepID=UPI0013E8C401|nr:hypothetical protein [Tropicibacter alexandrii]